jgi:hypothetical protein
MSVYEYMGNVLGKMTTERCDHDNRMNSSGHHGNCFFGCHLSFRNDICVGSGNAFDDLKKYNVTMNE